MPTKLNSGVRVLFVSLMYAVIYALMQNFVAVIFGLGGIWAAESGENLSEAFSNTVFGNLFVCTFAAMVAAFVLYILLGLLRERRLSEDLRFKPIGEDTASAAIILAAGCRLGVYVYTQIAQSIPFLRESVENLPDYSAAYNTPLKIILALFVTDVAAPVFEEILFRGFIQSELMRSFGIRSSIVLSSLIFAVFHASAFQSLFVFFVGLALGWCYYRTGSLFTGIIVHIIFNVSAVISIFSDPPIPLSIAVSAVAAAAVILGLVRISRAAKN